MVGSRKRVPCGLAKVTPDFQEMSIDG